MLTYSDNLSASLEAPDLDPQHLLIANELLTGKSVTDIANRFSISPDRVTAICDRPDTKRYIDAVLMTQGYMHRSRRIDLINRVIDNKLEEALDTGVYTKRDLLDWIKLLNEMDRDNKPKTPTTAVQINQNNNYSTLLQDLFGEAE